jgi:hypothetical protein
MIIIVIKITSMQSSFQIVRILIAYSHSLHSHPHTLLLSDWFWDKVSMYPRLASNLLSSLPQSPKSWHYEVCAQFSTTLSKFHLLLIYVYVLSVEVKGQLPTVASLLHHVGLSNWANTKVITSEKWQVLLSAVPSCLPNNTCAPYALFLLSRRQKSSYNHKFLN